MMLCPNLSVRVVSLSLFVIIAVCDLPLLWFDFFILVGWNCVILLVVCGDFLLLFLVSC